MTNTQNGNGSDVMMCHQNRKIAVLFVVFALLFTAFGAAGCWLILHFSDRWNGTDGSEIIAEAYEVIEGRFVGECDRDELTEAAISGMVSSLDDRWSHYLTAEEAAEYALNQQNVMVGIGVTVSKAEGDGMLIEVVHEGGGAAEAGLSVGDRIICADGVDLVPLTLEEGKNYVTGDEGTSVELVILHTDGTEETYTVKRSRVFIPPVSARMIGTVGYIKLENFDDGSADAFLSELETLINDGAAAFIFDVRYNGGGYVREMTSMLDRLLPEGEIFIHRTSDGQEEITYSDKRFLDAPMAVLVNGSSYSAAEYFAAVLQEYGAAVIVGEKTFGKGYSQQTIELSDGSALVLSTKMYCLPSRTSLADVGITPDAEVFLDEESAVYLYYGRLDEEDDLQLQAALQMLG